MHSQTTVFYKFNAINRGQLEHRTAIPAGYLGFSCDASQLIASKHHPGDRRIDSDNHRIGFSYWSETLPEGFGP